MILLLTPLVMLIASSQINMLVMPESVMTNFSGPHVTLNLSYFPLEMATSTFPVLPMMIQDPLMFVNFEVRMQYLHYCKK